MDATAGRVLHDRVADLVNQMLSVLPKIREAGVASDAAILTRHVAMLDHKIDEAVYELYRLSDDEVALVESSFSNAQYSVPA